MTTFLSSDPTMYKAYIEGKDLYAMIAQSAFDNNYEDNLEFYVPGTIVEIDGKSVVSGSGKEIEKETDEKDSITLKYYELLETVEGDKAAQDIQIGDKIISNIGQLTISSKTQFEDTISFTFIL